MKKNFKLITLAASLLLSNLAANAQEYRPAYLLQINEFITHNFQVLDSSGWFQAKEGSNLSFTNFLSQNQQSFGMGTEDGFILTRTTNDDYPFMPQETRYSHNRYNQTYKGVKVEYAEMFLHHKNNQIKFLNAKLAEGLNLDVAPTITEQAALTAVTNHLGATNIYSWQDTAWEAGYKDRKENPLATSFPSGEAIIAKINANKNYAPDDFKLAWKFAIIFVLPYLDVTVYVDAQTGAIIKEHSNLQDGQANNLSYNYGNGAYIDSRWRGGMWSHHVLRSDDANAPQVWTKQWRGHENFGGYNCWGGGGCTKNSFDSDDDWGDGAVTTPHWVITKSWEYFKNKFNRNGYDNNSTELRVFANADMQDAYWSTNPNNHYILFGKNNGNHVATKYIGGHEFTHAVTQYISGLVYQNESGALNESFSDIFGYEVERYLNNGNHTNWNLGEDAWLARRMNDPANSVVSYCTNQAQPAFYQGARWYSGSCDNGGVHINSGVQNYWFYLLTAGSSAAPNGTFNSIFVSGIGADKARNITFYNLDNFMGNNSQYQDAVLGSIASASIMYGSCSNELKQTKSAWAAVKMNVMPSSLPLVINGPSTIYLNNGNVWGGMPKSWTATGGINDYLWWTFSHYNWIFTLQNLAPHYNSILSATNFNNYYNTTTINVHNGCEIISKIINFRNLRLEPISSSPTDEVRISPNPTTNGEVVIEVVLLNANLEDPITIAVTDINGTPRFNQTYANGQLPTSFNFSNLEFGNYIVTGSQSGYSVQAQLSRH